MRASLEQFNHSLLIGLFFWSFENFKQSQCSILWTVKLMTTRAGLSSNPLGYWMFVITHLKKSLMSPLPLKTGIWPPSGRTAIVFNTWGCDTLCGLNIRMRVIPIIAITQATIPNTFWIYEILCILFPVLCPGNKFLPDCFSFHTFYDFMELSKSAFNCLSGSLLTCKVNFSLNRSLYNTSSEVLRLMLKICWLLIM